MFVSLPSPEIGPFHSSFSSQVVTEASCSLVVILWREIWKEKKLDDNMGDFKCGHAQKLLKNQVCGVHSYFRFALVNIFSINRCIHFPKLSLLFI